MSFIVRKPANQFSTEPHPEGITQAVCVDVLDLGMKATKFGEKHKVAFRFETPARDSKGEPIFVRSWPYSVSLNEKANLRKDLEKWRGRPFTPAELDGFDLESVIGAAAVLNIIHNTGDDGTVYSNVNGLFKDNAADKYKASGRYERQKPTEATDDDEVPF